MFNSNKLLLMTVGMYTAIVFVPSMLFESVLIPADYLSIAVTACFWFVLGVGVAAALFPFTTLPTLDVKSATFKKGFKLILTLLLLATVYILLFGPVSPLFAGLSVDNALDVALMREDALKLNQDRIFVRIYTWSRDLLAPISFIFAIQVLKVGKEEGLKLLAWVGLILSLFIGLWSGQKATVANYVLAAILFSATTAFSMARQLMAVVPVVGVVLGLIFAATLPQYFSGETSDNAYAVLTEAILHRVLLSPLEVAAAYIYSVDLRIVGAFDVLPLFSELWTPGSISIENTVAMEFFYSGIDSGSANALSFGYAYVLGGYIGCFLGGLAVVLTYKFAIWIVRSSGSSVASIAFAAVLSYQFLDLLNGNFLSYLVSALLTAVIFWVLGSLFRQNPVSTAREVPLNGVAQSGANSTTEIAVDKP